MEKPLGVRIPPFALQFIFPLVSWCPVMTRRYLTRRCLTRPALERDGEHPWGFESPFRIAIHFPVGFMVSRHDASLFDASRFVASLLDASR